MIISADQAAKAKTASGSVRKLLGRDQVIKPSITSPAKLSGWDQAETATELELADGKAPDGFRIFKQGQNVSLKGNFIFDDEAARLVMEAWATRKIDLMMDYEHMSLVKPPIIAPASCKKFVPEIRNGELWATQCQWTDRARDMIEQGEIRYFSPAFNFDTQTMRIVYLINVALTNNPALDDIRPLVAATAADAANQEIPAMKIKCTACSTSLKAPDEDGKDGDDAYCSACLSAAKLAGTGHKMLGVLGLSMDMGEQAILSQTEGLAKFRTSLLSLTGQSTLSGAEGVIRGLQEKAAKADALEKQLATAEEAKLAADFNGLVEGKVKEMIVSPAEAERMLKDAKGTDGKFVKDRVEYATGMLSTRTAPVVATKEVPQSEGAMVISPAEREMAIKMGKDPEEYAKWKAGIAKSAAGIL